MDESRGDAGKFHVLRGTPFLITPYRYQKLPTPKIQIQGESEWDTRRRLSVHL